MGFTLKALRVNTGLSRPDLIDRLKAEKGVELKVGTLANYENMNTAPDVITAKALASFYKVSVDDIIFLKTDCALSTK